MLHRILKVALTSTSAPLHSQFSTSRRALMTVKLPELPYDYHELEPLLSREILETHHSRHHKTYVTNYNALVERYKEAEANKNTTKMVDLFPLIQFNYGGHINHSLYWDNLTKPEDAIPEPSGNLLKAINQEFKSFAQFKTIFSANTNAIQGSGWGVLGYNPATDRVEYTTSANQNPITSCGLIPLLVVDVWEHAYYLQYKNVRAEYMKNIWNLINWESVQKRYSKAKKRNSN